MTIPFQRWYPYVEGYSPNFVTSLIKHYSNSSTLIYEPFAGTGTTLFAADSLGINTIYSEINPLLQFVISTKLQVLSLPISDRLRLADSLKKIIPNLDTYVKHSQVAKDLDINYKSTFKSSVYFLDETYQYLLKIRTYIDNLRLDNILLADLLTMAVISSLLAVSNLTKRGDVRYKTDKEKENTPSISACLSERINVVIEDLQSSVYQLQAKHRLICENAKSINDVHFEGEISDVITSPPYLNGTNYFRNTKLELWFLRHLTCPADLRMFRNKVLTSGINDVILTQELQYGRLLDNVLLFETLSELKVKSYDKRIPMMVTNYFDEMAMLFSGLTKYLSNNAHVMIDIGDSIFAGVHVRTDDILITLLSDFGYQLNDKVTLRQRRSKNGQLISQVLIAMTKKSE
ncbi:MAG: site-specific DNA-methyltransferase [Paludibacteraceae bacterium]|nr:site-specific DNA-methyltransferase [Paludibacteraceae bacterium]